MDAVLWNISELPTFPYQLSYWVERAGACNLIWYQSQRSRVQILTSTLIKIITAHSNIQVCGLGEPVREGECWSISELPTFPYHLKLLSWTGWCMQLNTKECELMCLASATANKFALPDTEVKDNDFYFYIFIYFSLLCLCLCTWSNLRLFSDEICVISSFLHICNSIEWTYSCLTLPPLRLRQECCNE
jgi:hypothetical protein